MKQRKVVSMIGVLVVMISTVAFITGCQQSNGGKSSKTEIAAEYIGSYEGTFSGDISGTWKMSSDKFGSLAENFNDSSTDYPASGKLESNGNLSGEMDVTAYNMKIAFTGTVDKSTGKVNGTWENATINKRGTFTGSKK